MHSIDSWDDPRLAPYRNMKDKALDREGRRFIAEGEQVVRRLLASGYQVESVLLSERKAALASLAPETVPVWMACDAIIERVIGFEFHSGVLAVGVRPAPVSLEQLCIGLPAEALLVVCPNITNVENLGSLIRISAAFGANAMVLGEQCCDPWFRQSVRVSMGTIFRLPIVRSEAIAKDLQTLGSRWNFTRVASVLDPAAKPLKTIGRPARLSLLLGNESNGLSAEHVALCDVATTIPMRLGTDSLNVAIAAGIFLYHFT